MADIKIMSSKVAAPKHLNFEAMNSKKWEIFPHLVTVMVLLTLVSIFHVWSRVMLVEMNLQMTNIGNQLKNEQQEQNRLKLEVASMRTPVRIESLAKGELGMALPTEQQVVIVK